MTEAGPAPLPQSRLDQDLARLRTEPVDDAFGGTVHRRGYIGATYQYPDVQRIMERAGVVFRLSPPTVYGNQLYETYIPNVARFRAATTQNGIPITLIAETSSEGNIPAEHYAAALRNRTHPVGIGDFESYDHDVAHDHMPAIAVGGDQLFGVMLEAMADVIDNDVELSERYDIATMNIRKAIFGLVHGAGMDATDRYIRSTAATLVTGRESLYSDSNVEEQRVVSVDRQLRMVITSGLKRLGIKHRNILHKDDQLWYTRLLGGLSLGRKRP